MSTTDALTRSIVDRVPVMTPAEVAAIRARVEWTRRPWWRRAPWRRPAGYGTGRFGL